MYFNNRYKAIRSVLISNMSVFSNRTYNELYIGTRNGQSLVDSNICRSRQRSITWATKDNRIHYFDPRKSIIGPYENYDTNKKDELEYESESESNYNEDDLCSAAICLIS